MHAPLHYTALSQGHTSQHTTHYRGCGRSPPSNLQSSGSSEGSAFSAMSRDLKLSRTRPPEGKTKEQTDLPEGGTRRHSEWNGSAIQSIFVLIPDSWMYLYTSFSLPRRFPAGFLLKTDHMELFHALALSNMSSGE